MKISELIARLEACKAKHGDVEVYTRDYDNGEGAHDFNYFEIEDVWEYWDEATGETRLTAE